MSADAALWHELLIIAEKAGNAGEIPVAAAITHHKKIISIAHNLVETSQNPLAHAEMLAIQAATKAIGSKYLTECDLYITLEPCAMCAGAIAHSRIRRVYFGAYDLKAGAVDNGIRLFHQPTCHHRPEIYGGLHEQACTKLLQDFFIKLRIK